MGQQDKVQLQISNSYNLLQLFINYQEMNSQAVNFTLTSSNILSQVYNNIQIPRKGPKCVVCFNKKFQQEFQQKNGFKNPIQQPQVQVFLCNFCQKISQPKCQQCFKLKNCCSYSEPIKYQQFYSNTKKQCLKIATGISNIFKSFSALSSKDISFQNKNFPTMFSITNRVISMITKIQQQYNSQIEKKIIQNNKNLHQIYKNYEESIKNRFFNKSMKTKNQNFTLQQLYRFSRQIQKQKNDLEFQGSKVCQEYILSTSQNYCRVLYSRMIKELKSILIPQLNQKDALVQTLPVNSGISSSGNNNSDIHLLNQKVSSLQNIIKKNLETMSTLNERIKDLQFIVSVQQQRNQQNEMKILQLQVKCGFVKGDDSIQQSFQDSKDKPDQKWKSKKDNLYHHKALHRSQIFRTGLKQSRSATNILSHTYLSQIQGKDQAYEDNYLHLDSSMQKN